MLHQNQYHQHQQQQHNNKIGGIDTLKETLAETIRAATLQKAMGGIHTENRHELTTTKYAP